MRMHAHCNHFIAKRHVAVPQSTMGFTSHDLHTLSIVKQRPLNSTLYQWLHNVPGQYPGESGESSRVKIMVKGQTRAPRVKRLGSTPS